jgi:hypothetical protein
MSEDAPFLVDNAAVALNDTGEFAKLVFSRDTGESREVILRREWLPMLVVEIQSKIAPSQATPIDRGSLHMGQNFSLRGFQARRVQSGGATLTLFVDLPDQGRGVTIPLDLTSEDVDTLIKMLSAGSPSG